MEIVILDAYTITQGELNFDFLSLLGNVTSYDRTLENQIIERVKNADIVLTNKVIIDKEVIDNSNIKMIQVLATGYSNIDTTYAKEKGIIVCNIPAYSTDSVAQIIFSYILEFANHVSKETKAVKNGKWTSCIDFMFMSTKQTEIANKTLGIIGYGKIGKKVEQIAKAFGLRVIVYTRTIKDNLTNYVSIDKLAQKADFISVNCPLTMETKNLINKEFLKKMKKTAYLINTSRGLVVNEMDLAEALNNDLIAGAAVDVLSTEPPLPNNPLLSAKNIIITPHLAWATIEARERLLEIVNKNITQYLKGDVINQVN